MVPDYYRLWDLADQIGYSSSLRKARDDDDVGCQFRVTIFGCSARYLAALEEQHASPRTHNKLDTVHTILSTGSPLHGQVFEYIYKEIKENVLLGSITGGTDIM